MATVTKLESYKVEDCTTEELVRILRSRIVNSNGIELPFTDTAPLLALYNLIQMELQGRLVI